MSRAYAHILRLSRARLLDLVASDWAARLVLRCWRIRLGFARALPQLLQRLSRRPSANLVGHIFVLGLGFLLVTSAMSDQTSARPAAARTSTGNLMWSASFAAAEAPDSEQVPRERVLMEQARPTATPTPTSRPVLTAPPPRPAPPPVTAQPVAPPPGSGGSGLAAIYAVFGNSPGLSWALRVAKCESGYNPRAVNPSSGASGLFQFMPSTWNANFPGQNIWDPYAQAHAALVFYNEGRQSAWTCK